MENQKDLKDMTLGDIVKELFVTHKELERIASGISMCESPGYQHNDPYPEVTERSIIRHEEEYKAQEQKFGNLITELNKREQLYKQPEIEHL